MKMTFIQSWKWCLSAARHIQLISPPCWMNQSVLPLFHPLIPSLGISTTLLAKRHEAQRRWSSAGQNWCGSSRAGSQKPSPDPARTLWGRSQRGREQAWRWCCWFAEETDMTGTRFKIWLCEICTSLMAGIKGVFLIIHTLPVKSLGSVTFLEIKSHCLPRLHLFDQKYSKNSKIVKYYYNLK